jgi:hypothetical protein
MQINSVDDFQPHHMNAIAELLQSVLPQGVGFGIVLFDGGEGLREFRYVSNCPREEMFECFQSLVAKWRQEKNIQENN